MPPALKLATEMGPLIAFFVANAWGGIFWATGVYMVAAGVALAISWAMTRRLAIVPIVTLGFVVAFGALTLWLADETFIKVKVSIINALFGVILLTGLAMRRPLLKLALGEAVNMDAEGWRKLTIRWALFFFAMAALNEVVWRSFSTDAWVNFKVFGLLPLAIVFAMAQIRLMQRHMVEEPSPRA
ncbi:MAG TPA: septation protein A [Aestuariivirgaceae bacterium]|nr:septation protein A [Aestuariivirgaceae bacterium]